MPVSPTKTKGDRPHPGTKVGREAVAWNKAVSAGQFEWRFRATPELLASRRWDFIIVGAGSAGCVLASRLAKNPQVNVLLLEAGGEIQNIHEVRDQRSAAALCGSEVDWCFRSTPQPQLQPAGRVVDLERGKGLGGSSCLNYAMWVRGEPQDFDRWARECGCGEEWSYQNVLPHFESIESYTPGGKKMPGRGDSGEMTPTFMSPQLPEVVAFVESCTKNGMKEIGDYNGPDGEAGVSPTQFSCDRSRMRGDAFNAFVEPVLSTHKNLVVASQCYTRKVLVDNDRCVGVEVQLFDDTVLTVAADREVILCAGGIQSPQILMLSGIGDSKALKKLGIPLVADIPAVGQHLQDHCTCSVPFTGPADLMLGFDHGSLPAGTTGLNGVGFWKSEVDKEVDRKRGSDSGTDMELILVSRITPSMLPKSLVVTMDRKVGGRLRSWPRLEQLVVGMARRMMVKPDVQDQLARTFLFSNMLNHPQSRGSVTLASKDPFAPPVVDPAWLRDPIDLQAAVEGVKKIRDVMKTEPFSKFLGNMDSMEGIHGWRETGFEPFFKATDAQLKEFVLRASGTTWHYSCSARMGAADAPLTEVVLDPRLRVRNIKGLRVADQSITPFVVTGNTNASSMMIGDKAAKIILEDHGLGSSASPPRSNL